MNKRLDKKRQKLQNQAAQATAPQSVPAAAPQTTEAPAAAPECKVSFYIQYQDQEYLAKDILKKITNECTAQGASAEELNSLSIYMKPEDKKAYYVCGAVNGSIDL